MNPMDNVIGRLQEISDRISEIQGRASLPPTLRARAAASGQTDAANAQTAASGAATSQNAALAAAQVSQFQTLLDQVLSTANSDDTSGVDTASLGLLDGLVGTTSTSELSTASTSAQLQQYQQMLLDTIRKAGEGG